MKKNSSNQFDKFKKKKSNAAIKEQFKQEKRKWKKEREEFFERKKIQRSEVGSQKSEVRHPTSDIRHPTSDIMPLNKFIAHCGVCSRRDAAELVRSGKVKVNNETITEPGHKVSAKDEIKANGRKIHLSENLVY